MVRSYLKKRELYSMFSPTGSEKQCIYATVQHAKKAKPVPLACWGNLTEGVVLHNRRCLGTTK